MDIVVEALPSPGAESRRIEIVERKGLGHPDTICDAIAESFSCALSRFYFEHFGAIAHHNVDKALLWGGMSRPVFGGGEVLKPMEMFLAGRATCEFRGITIPMEDIAARCAQEWFAKNLHAVDPARHLRVHSLVRAGSSDLVALFERQLKSGVALANDTSCGVGFAPLSDLERVAITIERTLNAAQTKRLHPEVGEDIKVMAVRNGYRIDVTLAVAFIDRFVSSRADYLEKKEIVSALAIDAARTATPLDVSVTVNSGDDPAAGNFYLTVTGTSAEAGDDGEVGRGNRVNGLITPFRTMTMEAAAGKNPVSHVGKLYNIAANAIATAIVGEIDGIRRAECCLVSQIGRPVTDPKILAIGLEMAPNISLNAASAAAKGIARDHVSRIGHLWRKLLEGLIPVY